MKLIIKFLKKIIPKKVLNLRHFFYAWLGAFVYRHPSEKLFVIGVTGTSGKSSTVYFATRLLAAAGFRVGALSTIEFYINGESRLNDKKMTMVGKMFIQKYLRRMLRAGCEVAIIETTSEGALQHRHKFINYDMVALTNLYPEHIEAHGGFENYKAAKLAIFKYVAGCKRKNKRNVTIGKTAIVNAECKYKEEFLGFNFDKKIIFGQGGNYAPINLTSDKAGLRFTIGEHQFSAPMYGEYNIGNLTAAIAVARHFGVAWEKIKNIVAGFANVPGRMEFIPEAEKFGIKIIVDYAFEPGAMGELYKVVKLLTPKRVIHVFGATGGGRDRDRRFVLGDFAGRKADICIVTNEDPYDEHPMVIIKEVAAAAAGGGKILDENLFIEPDRRQAIKKAIDLAATGDLILLTGKGSEQAIVSKSELIPWDDRRIAREILTLK